MDGHIDIYLDIIIMENIVMNYLILWVSGKFAKAGVPSIRLFLGAVVGAAYVLVLILFPQIGFYYSIPSKIMLSMLIVAVAFSPKGLWKFLKTLVIFYTVTFVFAGASFAALYLNRTGSIVRNGIIYAFTSSKWATVALAVLTTAIILKVFWETIQYRLAQGRLLRKIEIYFEERKADLSALIDTGNSLHDPVTDLPVLVVEFIAIKNILPDEICEIFLQRKEDDLSLVANMVSGSSWYSRFRLIPYTSLGKENGMLLGFKPDYIEITEDSETKKGVKDVIVGIYNKTLSRNKSYQALLSPDLL